MYRRTFEVIAKYIAKENKVTLAFDAPGESAYAEMDKNILHLPKEIANENAYGALALTMHEAAHIRHSKGIPIKEICPMKSDFDILNAIEDIRIDLKNFQVLPNIREFYEELVRKHLDLTKPNKDGQVRGPEDTRLVAGILEAEGFSPKMKQDDRAWMNKNQLTRIMKRGTQEIEYKDWKKVRKTIEEIKTLLKIDPKKDVPNTKTEIRIGDGSIEGKDATQAAQAAQGKGNGQSQGQPPGPGHQPQPGQLNGAGVIPSTVWGKGEKMPGGSAMATSPLAMDEQCANQFKEILNVKETRIIKEGSILDTDNLVSYMTGDIEELFKEERTVRKKKSKVFFLIDASGSMTTSLLDGRSRASVVKSCVQKLTAILDEVQNLEGINVDWDIGQFDNSYRHLTKENWQHEYLAGGGTSFDAGFDGALEEMLHDYTIEGKRIIVAFTDGDVNPNEVDHVNARIRATNADVRSLVIGVGSDMTGKFVKDLVGDNVIIAEDNATEVIMETIKAML